MRYLIISDTHGNITYAINAIESIKPDYCIHLGDMAQDCEDLQSIFPRQKFIFVKGNNDYWLRDNSFPDERVFSLEGKTFFICHGHRYHVKSGCDFLKREAGLKNADIVLYGHTHIQKMEWDNDVLILNPGSRDKYAIITIKDNKINAELY